MHDCQRAEVYDRQRTGTNIIKHFASALMKQHNEPGVNFINIFGKQRMAKSAKSPANCRNNQNSVRRKSLMLFLACGNRRKAAFCHSRKKAACKYIDEIDARVFVNVVAFFIKFLFYPGWGANLGFHLFSHALPLSSSGSPEGSIFSLA